VATRQGAGPNSQNELFVKHIADHFHTVMAGAFVLCMGAIASLLLVVWQSKCHCKCNLCYLFQCERRPPSEDEMTGLQDQLKQMKKKTPDEEDPPDPATAEAAADEEDLLPPIIGA